MDASSELPRYKIVETEQSKGWFAAPDLIPAGSIVSTDAPFGPHFAPLNEAAKAKMQAWLDEEYQMADKKGEPLWSDGKPVMYKPHRQSHFAANPTPSTPHQVQVESTPSRTDGPKLQTLAEIMAAGPASTDQRPPPSPFLPPRDYTAAPASEVVDEDGKVVAVVEVAGPPISSVTRKV